MTRLKCKNDFFNLDLIKYQKVSMANKKITIKVYFLSDGSTAGEVAYEYNPLDQLDIYNTAKAVADVICKTDKVNHQENAGLGVKMNMPPEFKPHLMTAINQVRTAKWNVQE